MKCQRITLCLPVAMLIAAPFGCRPSAESNPIPTRESTLATEFDDRAPIATNAISDTFLLREVERSLRFVDASRESPSIDPWLSASQSMSGDCN